MKRRSDLEAGVQTGPMPPGAGRLEACAIVRRYDGVTAVDHVDLEAVPGRVTVVIGPNGAGKTTLFDCLSGMQFPDEGEVVLDGIDITDWTVDERARHGLARTFQHASVFPSLTVLENLRVGAENRSRRGIVRGVLGLPDRQTERAEVIVNEVIERLELHHVSDRVVAGLPTGTLRLVELGRALCTTPTVLLLDEPTSGLGNDETEALCAVLRQLAGDGLTLVLIEHDIDVVAALADDVVALAGGRVLASGPVHEVMTRPDVRASIVRRYR